MESKHPLILPPCMTWYRIVQWSFRRGFRFYYVAPWPQCFHFQSHSTKKKIYRNKVLKCPSLLIELIKQESNSLVISVTPSVIGYLYRNVPFIACIVSCGAAACNPSFSSEWKTTFKMVLAVSSQPLLLFLVLSEQALEWITSAVSRLGHRQMTSHVVKAACRTRPECNEVLRTFPSARVYTLEPLDHSRATDLHFKCEIGGGPQGLGHHLGRRRCTKAHLRDGFPLLVSYISPQKLKNADVGQQARLGRSTTFSGKLCELEFPYWTVHWIRAA